MPVSFSVKAEVDQVKRGLTDIELLVVPEAVQAGLNKTMKKTHTAAVREASKKLRVKQSYMRRKLRFQRRDRASRWNWEAGVFTILSDLPASAFGKPRQLKTGSKAGRYRFPGAFVASVPKGKGSPDVWKRTTKARFPIRKERIRVREELETVVKEAIAKVGIPEFRKLFEHEMEWRLAKLGLR